VGSVEDEFRKAAQEVMESWEKDPHLIPIYPHMSHESHYPHLKGFVGRDVFGRTFIDKCPNDEHHLTKAEVPPGKERPGCRFYLDDLIPHEMVGKEVEVLIDIRIIHCRRT
jgi:hypothetical protein